MDHLQTRLLHKSYVSAARLKVEWLLSYQLRTDYKRFITQCVSLRTLADEARLHAAPLIRHPPRPTSQPFGPLENQAAPEQLCTSCPGLEDSPRFPRDTHPIAPYLVGHQGFENGPKQLQLAPEPAEMIAASCFQKLVLNLLMAVDC